MRPGNTRGHGLRSEHNNNGGITSNDETVWLNSRLVGPPNAANSSVASATEQHTLNSRSAYGNAHAPLSQYRAGSQQRRDICSNTYDNLGDRIVRPLSHHRARSGTHPHSLNTGAAGVFPEQLSTSPARRQTNDGAEAVTVYNADAASITLPQWQPDVEVEQCPVCQSRFSWLYRKHHCRKCGRVVCATCSQHRIAIPEQYVVRSPQQSQVDICGSSINTILGSDTAKTVRVCNPCVPDPNFGPPPQATGITIDVQPRYPLSSEQHQSIRHSRHPPSAFSRHGSSSTASAASQGNIDGIAPDPTRHVYPNVRPPLVAYSPASESNLRPHPAHAGQRRSTLPSGTVMYHYRHQESSPSALSRLAGNQTDFLQHFNPSLVYVPRVQVAEEDECPVCGNELPLRDSSDDDAARARHIDDCIRSYGSQPPKITLNRHAEGPGNTLVEEATNPNSTDGIRTVLPQATSSSMPESSRGQGRATPLPTFIEPDSVHTRRPPRILEFRASEKDCVDDLGEQQECVICFEEFEEGDEMGRLECLCKFHKRCIIGWWRARSAGGIASMGSGCPTHVLHV